MTTSLWLNDPFVVACLAIVCVAAAALAILILALNIKREAGESSPPSSEPPVSHAGRHRP